MKLLIVSAFAVATIAQHAAASDLIYRPRNPGFGGLPNNFDYLISTANIQNRFANSGQGSGGGAPVITFPDINIDLGGALGNGNPATPAPTPTANIGTGSQQTTQPTN